MADQLLDGYPSTFGGFEPLPADGGMHLVMHPLREGATHLSVLEHGDQIRYKAGKVELIISITDQVASNQRAVEILVGGDDVYMLYQGVLMGSFDPEIGKTLYGQIVADYGLVAQILVPGDDGETAWEQVMLPSLTVN